ncbi:hypothetical protein WAX74_04270 [Psychrobacillus sp. FJAT-51614]|uniref:Uncharacterized protein n=1 Tax=Psychrobacillus mangrovi TaxID=3117745 RepID=A0ABU8F1J0_9BACI
MSGVNKIQFYIPSLLDFLDHERPKWLEEVKIVGVKTRNIKYFIGYPTQETTRIEQIVAEDFTIYDLHLNFKTKILSFYLESEEIPPESVILQKVFQTFAVHFNERKVGYLLYGSGKNRPKPAKVLSFK